MRLCVPPMCAYFSTAQRCCQAAALHSFRSSLKQIFPSLLWIYFQLSSTLHLNIWNCIFCALGKVHAMPAMIAVVVAEGGCGGGDAVQTCYFCCCRCYYFCSALFCMFLIRIYFVDATSSDFHLLDDVLLRFETRSTLKHTPPTLHNVWAVQSKRERRCSDCSVQRNDFERIFE